MSTKARKQWSWILIGGMCCFVLGVGYWANSVHQAAIQAQADRDAQTRRAELIVMTAPVAIIMCGGEARITVANPAAESMFGYSADELLGERIYKLIPPDIAYDHDKVFHAAEQRARDRPERRYAMYKENIQTEALCKDGTRLKVVLSISVIKYGGDVEFIATIRPRGADEADAPPFPPRDGLELPDVEQRIQSRMKAAR